MSLSLAQRRTAWVCFSVMLVMMLAPPWLFRVELADATYGFRAGYAFLWSPPPAVGGGPEPVVWWHGLHRQLLVVGIGMVVLLFLREARER